MVTANVAGPKMGPASLALERRSEAVSEFREVCSVNRSVVVEIELRSEPILPFREVKGIAKFGEVGSIDRAVTVDVPEQPSDVLGFRRARTWHPVAVSDLAQVGG